MEPSASVARDASAKATAMDQEEGLSAVDNIVTQFNAYEDFLDSQITTMDLYYLEVRAAASQSGHRLPASRSLRSPRVAGCSPPGGERGAAQFPAAEVTRRVLPPRFASVGTEFGALVPPRAEARPCAGECCLPSLGLTCHPGPPAARGVLRRLVPAGRGLLGRRDSGLTPRFSLLPVCTQGQKAVLPGQVATLTRSIWC